LQIKNVVLAKGKTHFLCLDRLYKNFSNKDLPKWTKFWRNYSKYGDRADLDTVIPEFETLWEYINIH